MTETFRVTIERRHPKGAVIATGTSVVQAVDKDEAARVAVAKIVETMKARNAKLHASRVAAGTTWSAASEDPKDYVVKGVRRAAKRRTA
jgi:hypothetical protein